MTEDEHVRCAAVEQTERDTRVGGVRDGSLTLDVEEIAAAGMSLDDEPLGGAGVKSETTASTAIPQPAIAMPV